MSFFHRVSKDTSPDKCHHDALARLEWMKRTSVPSFHACGIVNADIGYYQLARLGEDKRILVFALNLEDLQLKEYPGEGILFAHPEKLYGVNAYGPSASQAEIYKDLTNHQTGLQQAILDDYTLVCTAPDTYQSRSVSYKVNPAEGTGDLRDVYSIIDALHDTKLAAVDPKPGLYTTVRYPRVRLTDKAPIEPQTAIPHILEHFSGMLNRLMSGQEGFQPETDMKRLRDRLALRTKVYIARLTDNVHHALAENMHEWNEQKIPTLVEWFKRIWAFAKIPVVFHESIVELALSLWEALGITPQGQKTNDKTPSALKPYVRPLGLYTRLNAELHPLRIEKIRAAHPMTMEEAQLSPVNIRVRKSNPFEESRRDPPTLGSIRAPMGTILFAMPNTSLLFQANGIWMAYRHDRKETYVGYNRDLDTSSNPKPPPVLQEWLDNGKVLCYAENGTAYEARSQNIEDVKEALQEIIACDYGELIKTHGPKRDPIPYIIPARPLPFRVSLGERALMAQRERENKAQQAPEPA